MVIQQLQPHIIRDWFPILIRIYQPNYIPRVNHGKHQLYFIKMKIILLITIINVVHSSCSKSIHIQEGLEEHFSLILGNPDQQKKIWFKDSIVIFEIWAHQHFELNDSIIKSGYDLWKYTYLDLTTMKAQDYRYFKDSSKPVNNYYLTSTDKIEWGFYNNTGFNSHPDSTVQVEDTVINGQKFHRWINTKPQMGEYKFVLFVDCNSPTSIFMADRAFELRHPGCIVKRIDLVNGEGNQESSFEYKIDRTYLTKNEKAIFKSWRKNAKSTSLPLISYKEMLAIPMYPIPKEN